MLIRYTLAALSFAVCGLCPAVVTAQESTSYRVLATSRTSTMQKEMQMAAEAGFRFAAVMGGETSLGGKEVVVLMQKSGSGSTYEYRLLATTRTSTMQKELQEASDAGFEYVGQTVFQSAFSGQEVSCILERHREAKPNQSHYEYRLLATKRTSTLQHELQEIGDQGFVAVGMTVGETAIGGSELVVITRRTRR